MRKHRDTQSVNCTLCEHRPCTAKKHLIKSSPALTAGLSFQSIEGAAWSKISVGSYFLKKEKMSWNVSTDYRQNLKKEDQAKLKWNEARILTKQQLVLVWLDFKQFWSVTSWNSTLDLRELAGVALVLFWAVSPSSQILWCTIVVIKIFTLNFLGQPRPLFYIKSPFIGQTLGVPSIVYFFKYFCVFHRHFLPVRLWLRLHFCQLTHLKYFFPSPLFLKKLRSSHLKAAAQY